MKKRFVHNEGAVVTVATAPFLRFLCEFKED